MQKQNYPQTRKTDHYDVYFNTGVADPYRWLEDDLSADTHEWVLAQNAVTLDYLARIPFRDAIRKRLGQLMDYERFSQPFKEGGYTYFYRNSGLQNQSVLYRQQDGEEAELFLDPNTLSADGTTSLAGISFSKDGSLCAYQLSEGGSDWTTIAVIRCSDRSLLTDRLTNIKFSSVAWYGNEGFYYSTYPKPETGSHLSAMTPHHRLFYHRLGTLQSEDVPVFGGEQTPRRYISAEISEDERYLLVTAADSTSGNELYIKETAEVNSDFRMVVGNFDHDHYVIHTKGSQLFIYTNHQAPNGRVVTVDASDPSPENWKDLIPETEHVLTPSTGGGKLFASYIKDAVSEVVQYDLEGKREFVVALPGPGTAVGFAGKKDAQKVFYTFTSYLYPATIFKYDILTGLSAVYKTP